MSNHCEIIIPAGELIQEILVAELAAIGYEGFEETPGFLKAYIPESSFFVEDLIFLLNRHGLSHSESIIQKQNWNEVWESNFEPIQVGNFAGIRASFHPAFTNVAHEIVITPKMSFGTGHHATTYMMMELMQELDFKGTSVFDFGTGTGILAILAEKLGATQILAVDNDDWCIENASENILINQCKYIDIQKVDDANVGQQFAVILANINKHIILANIDLLREAMLPGGQLLLSGLLKEDEADITHACYAKGLTHRKTMERDGWIALWFF